MKLVHLNIQAQALHNKINNVCKMLYNTTKVVPYLLCVKDFQGLVISETLLGFSYGLAGWDQAAKPDDKCENIISFPHKQGGQMPSYFFSIWNK